MKTCQIPPSDVREIIAEEYRSGSSVEGLAERFHCPVSTIHAALCIHGVSIHNPSTAVYTPTEKEIAEGAEEIRQTWDEETRDDRSIGGHVPFSFPVISTADLRNRERRG